MPAKKPTNTNKAKQIPACKMADLLSSPKPKSNRTEEPTECVVCGKPLSNVRIGALRSMGTAVNNWTCTKDSATKKVLGQYMGEVGTSEMKIVDRIEDVSVRSMFRKSVVEDEAPAESEEPPDEA